MYGKINIDMRRGGEGGGGETGRDREGEREFPNCPLKGPGNSDYPSSNGINCGQILASKYYSAPEGT